MVLYLLTFVLALLLALYGVPATARGRTSARSEEHTSELQSRPHLVCRLLLEKKKKKKDCDILTITHVRPPDSLMLAQHSPHILLAASSVIISLRSTDGQYTRH